MHSYWQYSIARSSLDGIDCNHRKNSTLNYYQLPRPIGCEGNLILLIMQTDTLTMGLLSVEKNNHCFMLLGLLVDAGDHQQP